MKPFATMCLVTLLLFAATAHAQIVPPKPGVDMPQAYFDRVSQDKTAFQFRGAWIEKTRRIKENRQEFLATGRDFPADLASLPPHVRQQLSVGGTMAVPVFLGKFSNTGSAPVSASDFQKELFDGPWPTGTLTELYSEMSYGALNLTGTVYDWVTLSKTDSYYDGGCNGLCSAANTGEFLYDILQANDGSVDFGQYDNDGPDGIPNSGDDDGFVDFVAFVHPEIGGECGTPNIWSHRWVVQGWPEFNGQPYQTNDPRTGGGQIKVMDYVIQPALGCGGGMNEIGVFCHEFGHAFGLPDLYDTNGGGSGIGHHGLMGSGNWNTPTNPAHMSAWSKMELGWVIPIEVAGNEQNYSIRSVELYPDIYKLDVMEERFRRSNDNSINGSYSLYCGLGSSAANSRNWPTGAGYGNGWDVSAGHDFHYSGSGSVTLQYDVSYDTEEGFDFGYVYIEVDGVRTRLARYHGSGLLRNVTYDLTSYLSGKGATFYRIIVRFTSDYSWSDEDGSFNSGSGGPFMLDDISVTGGGENYSTNFESNEAGWYFDFVTNPTEEFFLVENRNRAGQFDQGLHAEGLVIWHIEQDVIGSTLGNTGGTSGTTNLRPAGVMVEEADGLRDLLLGADRGDSGDAFPGSTNNRVFDNNSTPGSRSHSGLATNVRVSSISNSGATMTASLRGGWEQPTASSISPTQGDQGLTISVTDISGTGLNYGVTFLLRKGGSEYPASTVQWHSKSKISGELPLSGVPAGSYDVVVRNPDGQEAVLGGSFTVKSRVPVLVQSFEALLREAGVELTWAISADEEIDGFQILRREVGEAVEISIVDDGLIERNARTYMDESAEAGVDYEYVLVVVHASGEETRSAPARVTTPGTALTLFQNEPNPFNPSTRIRFALPDRGRVALTIYDPKGRKVISLLDEVRDGGLNEIFWDGKTEAGLPVSSGVYFYELRTENRVLTKKLVLLR